MKEIQRQRDRDREICKWTVRTDIQKNSDTSTAVKAERQRDRETENTARQRQNLKEAETKAFRKRERDEITELLDVRLRASLLQIAEGTEYEFYFISFVFNFKLAGGI